jgi:hypothetical protein
MFHVANPIYNNFNQLLMINDYYLNTATLSSVLRDPYALWAS